MADNSGIDLTTSPSDDTDRIIKLIMDKYIQQLTTPPTPPNAFQVGAAALSQLSGGNTQTKGKLKGLGSLGQMGTSPFNTIMGGLGEAGQGALQGYNMMNPQPQPVDINKLTAIAAIQKARNGGRGGSGSDTFLPWDMNVVDKTTGKVIGIFPKGTSVRAYNAGLAGIKTNFENEFNIDVQPQLPQPQGGSPKSSTKTAIPVNNIDDAKKVIKIQAQKEMNSIGTVSPATLAKANQLGLNLTGVK
jgi:hypothetical protein